MEDDRAKHVEDLFQEAADLPPGPRRALLEARCLGDAELRRDVESLLSREAAIPPNFLITPPFTLAAAPGPQEPGSAVDACLSNHSTGTPISERIGRYRLVGKIGEGGCGTVYSAEQEAPLRRPVALKVIKLGMDTREVIARFEAERQALALMDHGGIAKVFDAGATETGRPFFVMELVTGVPITRYCDERCMSIRERLGLLAAVCHAVQHAHQKGVIHRDIKPSNVLVATENGRPIPKVIDFGIAKATTQALTDRTLATEAGQLIGTPEYMSPEQAETAGDVDTRSDVYSLGAVLYELLTGNTPFDAHGLRRSSLTQMQQIIRNQEPPWPSTRIRTLLKRPTVAAVPTAPLRSGTQGVRGGPGSAEAVASCRGTTAPGLLRMLRGDIDVIVAKCLAKERERRYSTAEELGRDLERYLRGEPIDARKDSAPYVFRKLVARHKGFVAAALGLVATISAGLVVSLTFWREAVTQRDTAQVATRLERTARERAQAAEAAATRRFDQVRQLSKSVLFDLHDQVAPLPGSTKVRDFLVRKGLEYLDELARDAHDAPDLLREVASGYDKLGEVQGSQHGHGANLGNMAGALDSFQRALAIRESLVARDNNDGAAHRDVAMSLSHVGDTLVDLGKLDDALSSYQRSLQEAMLVPDDARNRRFRGMLCERIGNIQFSKHEWDAALQNYRSALSAREQLLKEGFSPVDTARSLTVAHEKIGNVLRTQRKYDEALREYLESLRIREESAKSEPENAYLQRDLLVAYGKVGDICLEKGDYPEGSRLHGLALAIAEILATADAKNLQAQRDLAVCCEKVGDAFLARKLPEQAFDNFHRRLQISQAVLAADPLSVNSKLGVAISHFKIASAEEALAGAAVGTRSDPSAHWSAARNGYRRSGDLVAELVTAKLLNPKDAESDLEEISAAVARCDKGLAGATSQSEGNP